MDRWINHLNMINSFHLVQVFAAVSSELFNASCIHIQKHLRTNFTAARKQDLRLLKAFYEETKFSVFLFPWRWTAAHIIDPSGVSWPQRNRYLTQSDGGDFVVDREDGDVEVVHRKCAMQRHRWGRGVSVATAVRPSSFTVRDDEGDGVKHRLGSDLPSWTQTRTQKVKTSFLSPLRSTRCLMSLSFAHSTHQLTNYSMSTSWCVDTFLLSHWARYGTPVVLKTF